MNREISDETKEQYTVVLDGGSLEHVFNFPMAIKNCMEMVKTGGHYLGITPVNNFLGHGFFQFSPELYFSIFTRENGFELINLLVFEALPGATWYSVKNPRDIKGRVTLSNNLPVYLLIVAKKLAKTAIFKTIPQQSDYIAVWRGDQAGLPPAMGVSMIAKIKRILPVPLLRLFRMARQCCGFDARFFQPVDPTATRKKSAG